MRKGIKGQSKPVATGSMFAEDDIVQIPNNWVSKSWGGAASLKLPHPEEVKVAETGIQKQRVTSS